MFSRRWLGRLMGFGAATRPRDTMRPMRWWPGLRDGSGTIEKRGPGRECEGTRGRFDAEAASCASAGEPSRVRRRGQSSVTAHVSCDAFSSGGVVRSNRDGRTGRTSTSWFEPLLRPFVSIAKSDPRSRPSSPRRRPSALSVYRSPAHATRTDSSPVRLGGEDALGRAQQCLRSPRAAGPRIPVRLAKRGTVANPSA